jgi:hypothetical protein
VVDDTIQAIDGDHRIHPRRAPADVEMGAEPGSDERRAAVGDVADDVSNLVERRRMFDQIDLDATERRHQPPLAARRPACPAGVDAIRGLVI